MFNKFLFDHYKDSNDFFWKQYYRIYNVLIFLNVYYLVLYKTTNMHFNRNLFEFSTNFYFKFKEKLLKHRNNFFWKQN